jgi:hypothetical protein
MQNYALKKDGFSTFRIRNLPPQEMALLIQGCSEWKRTAEMQLAKSGVKRAEFSVLVTKYASLLVYKKNTPLHEVYAMAGEIATLFGLDNPFDLFCTRWNHPKFLGFYHVANLTFLPLAFLSLTEGIPSLVPHFSEDDFAKVFGEEILLRQLRLDEYFYLLTRALAKTDQRDAVEHAIALIPTYLTEKKDYEGVHELICEIQQVLGLPNLYAPQYMDVTATDDQIRGPFNAIVSTYCCLENL